MAVSLSILFSHCCRIKERICIVYVQYSTVYMPYIYIYDWTCIYYTDAATVIAVHVHSMYLYLYLYTFNGCIQNKRGYQRARENETQFVKRGRLTLVNMKWISLFSLCKSEYVVSFYTYRHKNTVINTKIDIANYTHSWEKNENID